MVPKWLALPENFLLISRDLVCFSRFPNFFNELHGPVNWLGIHQYHGISYFKVALRQIKVCCCFHHSVHPPPHACCLLDVIESGLPTKLYCFAILRVCIFSSDHTVSKISLRHNFNLGDLVDFSTRILLRHTNFIIRKFWDRNDSITLWMCQNVDVN